MDDGADQMTWEELQRDREMFEQNIREQYRILDEREAELEERRTQLMIRQAQLDQREREIEQRERQLGRHARGEPDGQQVYR